MLVKIDKYENFYSFYFKSNGKTKGIINLEIPKTTKLYPEFKNSNEYIIYNNLVFKNKKYFNRALIYVINYFKNFGKKGIVFFDFVDKTLSTFLIKNNFVNNGEFYIYEY